MVKYSLIPSMIFNMFLLGLLSGGLDSVFGFEAPVFFEQKCASCHTLGKGDDVGPELKGILSIRSKEWVAQFIRESQLMIKNGDPIGVELFNRFKQKKMPDTEISDADLAELMAYIDKGEATITAVEFMSALKSTPKDIKAGEDYFNGIKLLSKGGPSCLSCHSAGESGFIFGGGLLGPDLTNAFSNYNDNGLSRVLTKITFPSMVEVYKGKELTEQEVFQIKSYLYEADKKGVVSGGYTKKFLFAGIIGFLLLIGLFDLMWRDRRKNTRRPKF